MNKRYCTSCGTPNSYIDGVAPKFCGKCGKALQFVPNEKPKQEAVTSASSQSKNISADDIDKIVAAKLQALLRVGGLIKDSDDDENEIVIASDHIPTPSSNDVVVQTPKFMTVADIKKLDHPITRSERPKFQDYSKE